MISTGYRWPLYDGDADDTSEPLPGTINHKIIPRRSDNVTMPFREFALLLDADQARVALREVGRAGG
jgi:hypothetical protein